MEVHPTIRFLLTLLSLQAMCLLISACNPSESSFSNSGIGAYGDVIKLDMQADHKIVKAGDKVQTRLIVTNIGNRVETFESNDTSVLDIFIESGPTWSVENPDKAQHHLEMKPGENVQIELAWTVPFDRSLVRQSLTIVGRLDQNSRGIASAVTYVCVETCDPYH